MGRGMENQNIFWMVWREQDRGPAYVHGTLSSAKQEAQRLATLNPDSKFFVLQAIGCYVKKEADWFELGNK